MEMLTVSADVILRQNQSKSFNTPPFRWSYVSPTPTLESQGLTPSTLKCILDTINKNVQRDYLSKFNPCYQYFSYLPYIGILIGFGLIISDIMNLEKDPWIGVIIIAISIILAAISSFIVKRLYIKAVLYALYNMKLYVQVTLNQEWQRSNGIRWTIISERAIGSGQLRRGRRKMHPYTWNHIGISSIQRNIMIYNHHANQSVQSVVVIPIQQQQMPKVTAPLLAHQAEGINYKYTHI